MQDQGFLRFVNECSFHPIKNEQFDSLTTTMVSSQTALALQPIYWFPFAVSGCNIKTVANPAIQHAVGPIAGDKNSQIGLTDLAIIHDQEFLMVKA